MQNWKTEHTKEIKAWLNIDNYRKFEDLSLIHFYHELWARNLFFKEYREEFESRTLMGYFSKIFTGNPFLIPEGLLGYMTPANKLFQPPHFFLTTLDRLAETSIIAMQRGGFLWHEGDNYSINRELREESLSDIMPDQFSRTVMLEIDLASGTDEEIAESLKAALPQWRKIKGIDENPLESVRFGYGTIKKLISYRIIPMLDILVWPPLKKSVSLTIDYPDCYIQTMTNKVKMRESSQIKDTTSHWLLKPAQLILSGNFIFS